MENQKFSNSFMLGWRNLYLNKLLNRNKDVRTRKKLVNLKVIFKRN